MKVNVTDWVQGNSRRGELIHGYVEAVDPAKGVLDVFVVASDNEETVGTSVRLNAEWVKALPESGEASDAQLKELIDLSLSLGDEVWFRELADRLKQPNRRGGSGIGRYDGLFRTVNRLGKYGLNK